MRLSEKIGVLGEKFGERGKKKTDAMPTFMMK